MKFFQQIVASIYDRTFYAGLESQSWSAAVKYFAKFLAIVALLVSIIPIFIGLGLFFWHEDKVEEVKNQIISTFPEELELEIRDGLVSTNVSEPYVIPVPEEWLGSKNGGRPEIASLVVIDTTKPIDVNDFEAYQTAVIVSKDQIGFLRDTGSIQIEKTDTWNVNMTVTKDSSTAFIGFVFKMLHIMGMVLVVFAPAIIFLGLAVYYSVYLLFGALIVWAAAKLQGRSFTYGQAYRYGLYLLTLPIILSYPLSELFHFPFVFTLVLFMVAYWNFKPESVSTPPTPGSPQDARADVEKIT